MDDEWAHAETKQLREQIRTMKHKMRALEHEIDVQKSVIATRVRECARLRQEIEDLRSGTTEISGESESDLKGA